MAKLITGLVIIVCWGGMAYGFVSECLISKTKRATMRSSSRESLDQSD